MSQPAGHPLFKASRLIIIAATRNKSQCNRAQIIPAIPAFCGHRTCSSSQHGITDVVCLLYRFMEFARAGAVKHCTVNHLVAKLFEVLKCHLCQMFNMLAEKAKNSEDIRMQELEERQAFK